MTVASEDAVGMLIGAAVMVAGGVVVAVVGRLGRTGRLPRNHWAGIRLPSTMRDDERWAAAHRAGGAVMEAAGWIGAVLGATGAVLGRVWGDAAAAACILGGAAVMLAGVLWSSVLAVRAAHALDAERRR